MACRKLYSDRGTYLGLVTYPDEWERYLGDPDRGFIRFQSTTVPERHEELRAFWSDAPMPMTRPLAVAELRRCDHLEYGAVRLYGANPEQFERIQGCAFMPSAGYLRTLIE